MMADTGSTSSSVVEDMLASVKVEVDHDTQREDSEQCEGVQKPVLTDQHESSQHLLSQMEQLYDDGQTEQVTHTEAETNGHPSIEIKPQTSASSNNRLHNLRVSVEDKSHILSSAWNDLYNLLGEYKAELFSKEIMTQKYEGISDINQLKTELLEKDSEIHELKRQLQDQQEQNDEVLRMTEQSQLDLSVKDSLLKKYQEDLLTKESALMTSNTKISRLENKIRALESRATTQTGTSEPPRKLMRPNLAPAGRATPGRAVPSAQQRFTPNNSRVSPASRLYPGSAGRVGMAGRMTPGSMARRRVPAAPVQVARAPELSTARPTPSKAPIVCIEVEDDDEIQELAQATQQSIPDMSGSGTETGDSMYVDSWSEQEQESAMHTDTTSLESLPGTSAEQYGDVNQALMLDSQPQFPGQEDLGEGGPWPVQMSEADLSQQLGSPVNRSQPSQIPPQSSNKDLGLDCSFCGRLFTRKGHRDRHVRTVHLGIKLSCPICNKRLREKCDLHNHLRIRHEIQNPSEYTHLM